MTSTLLTRRSMLSSGVFVGLGALLAACGQQANNEGAATASAAERDRFGVGGGIGVCVRFSFNYPEACYDSRIFR